MSLRRNELWSKGYRLSPISCNLASEPINGTAKEVMAIKYAKISKMMAYANFLRINLGDEYHS